MKKITSVFHVSKILLLSLSLCAYNLSAQNNSETITNSYKHYTADAREVVYIHLNKSTYIKGESVGFTAYVLDKERKSPSLLTKNLYVSIEDENKKILQQKLIKVDNGVASNIFQLDSVFTSGYYKIKAYTNWMRNFNEHNHFIETIKIIDPEIEDSIKTETIANTIDAQFLPESGHIVNAVNTTIGVVLKDNKGFGIPNVEGIVTDKNKTLITTFKVNPLGIGKFPLLAELGNQYTITINYLNKQHTFKLKTKIKAVGISLSIKQNRNKATLALITNKESLKLIKNKPYKLTVHNGNEIEAFDITFNNNQKVIKIFDLNQMPSGVNIFTLFNENNKPILERLIFNYNGIDILKSNTISAKRINDSTTIRLNFYKPDITQLNNLSVSVLPQGTQSYNRHHNIISYTHLQPYIIGPLENAKYYFTDLNEAKKIELDNLLITQGWSSYDWTNIFNQQNNPLNYAFEQGIEVKANFNPNVKEREGSYMVSYSNASEPYFFTVENLEENHFFIDSLFPEQSERLYLSSFDEDNIIQPPKVYLQATPRQIPQLQLDGNPILNPKGTYNLSTYLNKNIIQFKKLNTIQELEEVLIKARRDKKERRIKKIESNFMGRAYIIGDEEIKTMFLANFLASKRYNAIDDHKNAVMVASYWSESKAPPALFLDGNQVGGDQLYLLSMSDIDYIVLERDFPFRKYWFGTIRVFSYPGSRREDNRKKKQEFQFPLTFESNKTFYVPKYQYYNDDFYINYGTTDWKPKLITDSNGNTSLTIATPQVPITLFIEGITNDGSFIFEEKSISLN
ncbi:hypothetical protein [uncultured Winogradskyella sp.]|uniref:hypothetical protein n=1 Tax=uncultured Winogradskyella sp. TaxID=395353 RepID=UPI0030D746AB|tara:strand:+ start:43227 stop:45614 length:2388 start_codon:yes stop_codon:yes gene_type:complete